MSADLRKLLKDAIAEHPDLAPEEIASVVAEAVPAKVLRGLLAEALVDRVRMIIGASRRNAMDGAISNSQPSSPKMRDRASWWAAMLQQRVHINGEWILLGDCTFEDLQAAIDDREQLIGRISGQIDNYRRLQKLLREHGVERVGDVPPQTDLQAAS